MTNLSNVLLTFNREIDDHLKMTRTCFINICGRSCTIKPCPPLVYETLKLFLKLWFIMLKQTDLGRNYSSPKVYSSNNLWWRTPQNLNFGVLSSWKWASCSELRLDGAQKWRSSDWFNMVCFRKFLTFYRCFGNLLKWERKFADNMD